LPDLLATSATTYGVLTLVLPVAFLIAVVVWYTFIWRRSSKHVDSIGTVPGRPDVPAASEQVPPGPPAG
jgi:hypothetical protein